MRNYKIFRTILKGAFITAIFVAGIGATFAGPITSKASIAAEIESLIEFPDFALATMQEAYVIVEFKILPSGAIEVLQTVGPNNSFERHVKRSLEASTLDVPADLTNVNFVLRINFKLNH